MSGLPEKLYTADQVRRLDSCAIGEQGIPGYELMKRAGAAAFRAFDERHPEAAHWMVLCGAGNNGGDGYVVARLASEAGRRVTLVALKSPGELRGDALTAAGDWQGAGGTVEGWPTGAGGDAPDLVVDALLGTGLDREVGGNYRLAISWINELDCPRVAVDIPSGLNADTGMVMGTAVRADATVSFIGLKRGLFTNDGPDHAGEVIFDSLQVPPATYDAVSEAGRIIRENFLARAVRVRAKNTHKGHYGHVLVAGGLSSMSGAVRLAGEAALRTGSGLVSIATHPAHAASLNLARPELMVSAVEEPGDMQQLLDRANVIALGPGLGQQKWSQMMMQACIASMAPMVVDADGLNLLAKAPAARGDWVLTPHPAEAARLLQSSAAEVQADRIEAARALADRYRASVVLKGCGTVVAHSGADYAICPLGNPGMATAGSGDVLTGVIASLLGQGFDTRIAAELGTVLHAAAGDHAAVRLGQAGMLAGDIVDSIPALLS